MNQSDSKNYLDWLKKADEDELNVVSILKHRDGTPGAACFLSQQMAEKYLKGLLVRNGKSFPKVHDLIQLQTLLLDIAPNIKDYSGELDVLITYYFETRYPGDYPEFSWADAEEAYTAAKKSKSSCWKKLSSPAAFYPSAFRRNHILPAP
jgi:HEPN domain-containing protein